MGLVGMANLLPVSMLTVHRHLIDAHAVTQLFVVLAPADSARHEGKTAAVD